ncbi:hypothetical protein ATANTOWER_012261 [Ataeniobius toweri]|uniref:Uncharacterized protein n=1 Tax=Ataeniobius toweri TaxID=208326 RepID=A0ABU7AFT1_9TELE|nr:hypothetical protein [Ataeniobius toweri]
MELKPRKVSKRSMYLFVIFKNYNPIARMINIDVPFAPTVPKSCTSFQEEGPLCLAGRWVQQCYRGKPGGTVYLTVIPEPGHAIHMGKPHVFMGGDRAVQTPSAAAQNSSQIGMYDG